MTPPTDTTATGLKEAIAREPSRLKYYPDYIDDPDGLERFRQDVLSNRGHAMAAVNHNSLGRLIDTIERLRRERDAALLPSASVGGERDAFESAARIADAFASGQQQMIDEEGSDEACRGGKEVAEFIANAIRRRAALAAPETPPTGNAPTPPALSEDLRVLQAAVANLLPIGNDSLPGDRVIPIYVRMDELRALHALARAQEQAS